MRNLTLLAAMLIGVLHPTLSAFAQTQVWTSFSSGYVYSILGCGSSRVILGTQTGIAISPDRGETWPLIGINKPVRALGMDGDGRLFAGSERGMIYTSSDSGATWHAFTVASGTTISSWSVTSFCVEKSGVVFASTLTSGIFASTDHGSSWHPSGFSGISVYSMAVNSQNTLFAVRYGDGLYQSTDGGAAWTKTGLASTKVRRIAVGLHDELLAGILNGGIVRSTDNGATWTPHGLAGMTAAYLGITPAGVPFASTASGLYAGSFGDTVWSLVPVPWSTQTEAVAFAADTVLYAATERRLFARIGAESWSERWFDTQLRQTNAISFSSARLIAASADPGVLVSRAPGGFWQLEDSTLASTEVFALATDPGGQLFASTGDGRILVSHDSGEHWKPTGFSSSKHVVFTLSLDKSNRLLAGTLGDGLFGSTDAGAHWNSMNSGLDNLFIRSLLPLSGGRILAGTEGGLYVSPDSGSHWLPVPPIDILVWCIVRDIHGALFAGTGWRGIYRSTDDGATWSEAGDGLASRSVRTLAVDSTGTIFAGTLGDGVFLSTDGGNSWASFNNGMPDLYINCLVFAPDRSLFAGTMHSWVQRISLQGPTGVSEARVLFPVAAQLEQNYPNPFNPTTRIKYTVGMASGETGDGGRGTSGVRLVVYDMLGREVAVLVDEHKMPGAYEATFDAGGLASGVYFYRLAAGSFMQSRKMLLMK
jgi:ligand-binding sensor domain-containing protein